MGKIEGCSLEKEQKIKILMAIQKAKAMGIPKTKVCDMWRIERRRVYRWQEKQQHGRCLKNIKPGPTNSAHKLLPMERSAVLQMATSEKYADLSHRTLAVTAWDLDLFFVSFSSV